MWPVPIRLLFVLDFWALRPGFNPWPTTLGGTFCAAIRFDLSLIGHELKRTGAKRTIRCGLSLFGHYFVLDVWALRPGFDQV
jgi:hypothetical protein